jgi:hypothetical protein
VFSATAFGAQITGTVTNGTSNKPSTGDQVVLLSLSGAMEEVAHTKTDDQGHYRLKSPEQGQSLIRVDHQGVRYFQAVPQGTRSVDVTVYDAANTIDHLIVDGHVFRFRTISQNQLEVAETFVVRNESSPPQTKMGDRSFDFDLPAGAEIEEGVAQGPGGMPTSTMPVPADQKNRYGFTFPIRPGRTRLQVTYKAPYAGIREFKVTPDSPVGEVGIMLPKSMQFKSEDPSFAPAQDVSGMTVFMAQNVPAGKELKFSVSGEGTTPDKSQNGAAAAQGQTGTPPAGVAEAPDTSSNSRWYIVTLFVVILAGAGYWLFRLQRRQPRLAAPESARLGQSAKSRHREVSDTARSSAPRAKNTALSGSVEDAIKEELFQLESDRLQGKVSQQEYETTKAGLEIMMRRHLKKG